MNAISFWFTRLAILLLFFLASALVILPFYTMLEGTLERHTGVRAVLGVLLLLWCLGIVNLAHVTASHMAFEDMTFADSLRHSYTEARVAIGLLPVLRRWFGPKHLPAPDDPIE